jgi:fluoride exporter
LNSALIALGGSLGAVSRYLLSSVVSAKSSQKFPTSIITVNLLGAGGLGLFISYYYESITYSFYTCNIYLCFGVGFFGAFTTFSTFSMEAIGLLQRKAYKYFLLYILLTIIGSITLFSIGYMLMQH